MASASVSPPPFSGRGGDVEEVVGVGGVVFEEEVELDLSKARNTISHNSCKEQASESRPSYAERG